MFHTGGTTGAPKLAAHTHANEVADAWMLAANPLFDQDSVVFAALPLFHVNALVVTLLVPLFKGQPAVWAGPLGYREPALFGQFWKIVEHYRIATMSAVPTVYAALAQSPLDADISSLRFAIVGASPLPPAVREGFQAHTGVPLLEGYGLTEATCATARSFPAAPRPGSVGQRLPYQQVKAVRIDEDGDREGLPAGRSACWRSAGRPSSPATSPAGTPTASCSTAWASSSTAGWIRAISLASTRRVHLSLRSGQGPDHPRRPQHRPGSVEDALLAHPQVPRPARSAGRTRTPARCPSPTSSSRPTPP